MDVAKANLGGNFYRWLQPTALASTDKGFSHIDHLQSNLN